MKSFLTIAAIVLAAALAFWLGQNSSTGRPDADAPAGAIENDPNAEAPAAKQDPSLALKLAGEWRSLDDADYTRVFGADGTFYDTYKGDPAGAPGVWSFATDGSGELWLDSEGDRMRFRVVSVTGSSLQLIYLDRGGALNYARVR